MKTVRVLNLKRRPYLPTFHLQKWFESQLLEHNADPVLVLVEHDPVFTAGVRENIDDKKIEALRNLGADFVQSNRGGLTTFHGHGQLVAYPIFHLERFQPRIKLTRFVSQLENTALHTCRMLGLSAQLSNSDVSHTGAWVNDKKICAIGVHCRRYVTTHGLALNNTVHLSWYNHIVPCGISDRGVTSIAAELGDELSMTNVKSQFLQSFQSTFKCQFDVLDSASLTTALTKMSI